MLTNHGNRLVQLVLRNRIRTGQDDGICRFDLVVIELAKVLHIYLDFAGIRHGNLAAKAYIVVYDLFHSADHIGKLTDTGGLNNDPVGMVFANDLLQRFPEITHQTAANTAGIHLSDVDTGILQKAAVNTDLTKLVLNKHQFFTAIGFRNHFFDQRGLASAQKSGINIDFCHYTHLLYKIYPIYYNTLFCR